LSRNQRINNMRIPGRKTTRRFSRWIQARMLGGAILLAYHRVANAAPDGDEECVTPGHFEEQMDALSRSAQVLSLSRLVRHLKEGSLPPRSVAVTFDDGYADNLYLAKPILEKYQVPGTVFVCGGYWGRQFWWDELETLVMSSRSDPRTLRQGDGWELPVEISKVEDPRDVAIRRKLRHALYHFLLPMDAGEQDQIMDEIRRWSGVSADLSVSARSMDRAELTKLAQCELIEIGSHTRTHPRLPGLSEPRQKAEILSGRQDLEELLGKPVPGFAYPNGQATAYTKAILRDAGFEYACISLENVIRAGSDPLALTRFWQKDVDGDRFLRRLNMWLK
jgi:peptidoglycan/xylan/chitin deacetylase (PgdA/CDA1 family)